MFVSGDRVVGTVGDLVRAADCEFAFLRALDTALGNLDGPVPDPGFGVAGPVSPEPGAGRRSAAGESTSGAGSPVAAGGPRAEVTGTDAVPLGSVGVTIDLPAGFADTVAVRATVLADAQVRTIEAVRAGVSRMWGAVFFDERFAARAGALVADRDGRYTPHGGVRSMTDGLTAALELAAAAQFVTEAGAAVAPSVLVHGPHGARTWALRDLAPVYLARRRRVEEIVEEKLIELLPVQWGDPRYPACGRCPTCRAEAATARDLSLVAGMRPTIRARLREAGVLTMDRLATDRAVVPGVPPRVLTTLRGQAGIQLRGERSGVISYSLVDPQALGALPAPSPGDLALTLGFGDDGAVTEVEIADAQSAMTMPVDGADPGEILDDVLGLVGRQHEAYPGMRVYHYGTAVRNTLLRWAARGGAGVDRLDDLLTAGALVDIAPVVRTGVLVGTRTYTLDDLAALLPAHAGTAGQRVLALRDWLLDRAAAAGVEVPGPRFAIAAADAPPSLRPTSLEAALTEFATADTAYTSARFPGDPSWYTGPDPISGDTAGVSGIGPGEHRPPTGESGDATAGTAGDGVDRGLPRPGPGDLPADSEPAPGESDAGGSYYLDADPAGEAVQAASLAAAVLGYHRRERQARWWAQRDRLSHPVGEWADAPGVFVGEWGTVDTKWHRTPQHPTMRRYLTLTGRLGTGAAPTPGTEMITLYDGPAAAAMTQALGRRATATATVLGWAVDADFADTVRLEELLPEGCPAFDDLPAAVLPAEPEGDRLLEAAAEFVAQDLLMTLPWVPENAVFDLLCRRPPRLRDRDTLPEVHGDMAAALADAVGALDASYLAVQGPPGTGKTATVSRAVARLVTRRRWRIGVVARSHAAVERILDAVVDAGLLPELVAKKDVAAVAPEWSAIDAARYPRFLDNAVNGCVIGGTPADFADDALIARGALDLLVVVDAGSCPLADTVAVAASARNLLLVGDPVPSRAAAAHPAPIDVSVLEWLCEDAATLPAERGYFLDRTWRLHPAVCGPVSDRYYDGRLRANETVTLARTLDGVAPGVRTVPVPHRGSATESDAEAKEVVRRVRGLLGAPWTVGEVTRRLHPHDILVVAPYAAQVARIRTLLARAKIDDVVVGTPDRFHGREAAVVLVSLTTSTPADAPGPMPALLSRDLVHAALCRAMWAAVIIRSPLLTEYLPGTPEELGVLADFLSLG